MGCPYGKHSPCLGYCLQKLTGHEKEEIRKGKNRPMQDEVMRKLCPSVYYIGGKISAQILKSALLKTLTKLNSRNPRGSKRKGYLRKKKFGSL